MNFNTNAMRTKKDFEVTDPKEIIFADEGQIEKSMQENFSDEANKIADAQEKGVYDSYTAGIMLIPVFQKLFTPTILGISVTFQVVLLLPVEWYIYVARKVFKHNFSQKFRKNIRILPIKYSVNYLK